ncbi:hypothetical protein BaRGS_00004287, partial [Batillaria attramentaria]
MAPCVSSRRRGVTQRWTSLRFWTGGLRLRLPPWHVSARRWHSSESGTGSQ